MVIKYQKRRPVGLSPVLPYSACGIALLRRTSNAEAYAGYMRITKIHIRTDIRSCFTLDGE